MFAVLRVVGAFSLVAGLAAGGLVSGDVLTGGHASKGPPVANLALDKNTTFQPLAVGAETSVSAGDAGTVAVKRTSAGLEAGSIQLTPGWEDKISQPAADSIAVLFETSGRRIALSLDMVGDDLRVRTLSFTVETTTTTTEPPTTTTEPPTTTTQRAPLKPAEVPVAEAGAVIIVVRGPVLVVSDVKPKLGWVARILRVSGDNVVVAFVKGPLQVQFTATRSGARWASRIERHFDGDIRGGFDRDFDRRDGWGDHDGRDLCACDGRRH